jgi:hypothetical protein
MDMVAQITHRLQTILDEEAETMAKETKFLKRKRKMSGADFVQQLIFAWWQEPTITLEGLVQIGQRREVAMTASGISQRFTLQSALLMERILQRLSAEHLQADEQVPVALLQRFSAVFVEDSSVIALPESLAKIWQGCGGRKGNSGAALKLFVRWEVLRGSLEGPTLRPGRHSDGRSPLAYEDLPVGSLCINDLGFFSLERFRILSRPKQSRGKRRYFLTRWQPGTALLLRSGHHINLSGIVPQQVAGRLQMGVLVGAREKIPMRMLIERVPPEVAAERQQRMREAAAAHGREVTEEMLHLAHWSIILTNVPTRLLSFDEALILLRLRWQIERLFRLWKEHGFIDEWRSKKSWRILTEIYAKLSAMVIQQWLITAAPWQDPERSLVKAAQALRREANWIMVALYEGGLEATLHSILRTLQSGCRLERRQQYPSTAQLVLGWPQIWPEEKAKPRTPPRRGRPKKAVAAVLIT